MTTFAARPTRPTSAESTAPARRRRRLPRGPLTSPERAAMLVAGVIVVGYLLAPPMGTDLAAQLARADFAGRNPSRPIDLNWFGGTDMISYSVLSPHLMAWVGVLPIACACCVIVSGQFARLLVRTDARRPVWGAVAGAVLQGLNLVAGRTTFALGLVFGFAALLSIAAGRPTRRRRWAAAGSAMLCGLSSPVAALFLAIAGAALVLTRRPCAGLLLAVPAATPVLVTAVLFGQPGTEPFTWGAAVSAAVPAAVVAFAARGRTALRTGALVAAVATVCCAAIPTPVGDNIARLTLLFAVPLVAAYAPWRPAVALVAIVVAALPQQPAEVNAFGYGSQASAAFYRPLVEHLHRLGPLTGRLEVPETRGHWDAAVLAASFPLARGWLRQLDVARNPLFFSGTLTASAYRRWLDTNAVEYVAVPRVALTTAGRREAAAIAAHPAYLVDTWRTANWTVYRVRDSQDIVAAPAQVLQQDAGQVTFRAPPDSTIHLAIADLKWITVATDDSTACLRGTSDATLDLHTVDGGVYTITSSLRPRGRCR